MKSFEQIAKDVVGTVYVDRFEDGLRFVILRGPVSLCSYIGILKDHPLANHDYDDLPVDCHGGLTYGSYGLGEFDDGFYWYGWDYAHAGDVSLYSDRYGKETGTKWTIESVEGNSYDTLVDFKKLLKLAERIANRKERG